MENPKRILKNKPGGFILSSMCRKLDCFFSCWL